MVKFLEPESIIAQIDLRPEYHGAEFGSGAGGFAIPLAKKLGKGVVYGLDIQAEPLSALVGRAREFGVPNIRTIECDLEEPKSSGLPDNSLDIVIVSNILFQSENQEAMLKEAKRLVKLNSNLIIIDWNVDSPFGPVDGRISAEDVHKIAVKLELKKIKDLDVGTYHWGAVYAKV